VGSWNVNGKPPSESLTPWLVIEGHVPDIVVCGLQELDQSTSAMVFNSETAKAEPWINAIGQALARMDSYSISSRQQLGGVLQLVWVRKDIWPRVNDMQSQSTSTGFAGIMANKGGVAVRFDLYDSTFCFVCAHLNAHDENVERRNQDFASIVSSMKFTDERSIWDHQFVFWYGDLNYRIALPRTRIFDLIAAGSWNDLLLSDQLSEQRHLGNAFTEFSEGKIEWAPTYRFDVGTNTYDTSEKQRKPSYTDRVLHKAASASSLELHAYQSVPVMLLSDHKPVFAVYVAQARELRTADYARVYQSIVHDLDKLENSLNPSATFSTQDLDFGDVRYGVQAEQQFVIRNTGPVLVSWRFIPKPNQGSQQICRPWVHVDRSTSELLPGAESTVTVKIMVEGAEIASELAQGRERLEDMLVLHLEQGKVGVAMVSATVLHGDDLTRCVECAMRF
jgi:phosphatidylinositol-bisphosphatase